jgi:hypothetical protein
MYCVRVMPPGRVAAAGVRVLAARRRVWETVREGKWISLGGEKVSRGAGVIGMVRTLRVNRRRLCKSLGQRGVWGEEEKTRTATVVLRDVFGRDTVVGEFIREDLVEAVSVVGERFEKGRTARARTAEDH